MDFDYRPGDAINGKRIKLTSWALIESNIFLT